MYGTCTHDVHPRCAPSTPSPLCRYTPDANGRFAGQAGYGFVSIARFLAAAADINAGRLSVEDVRREGELAVVGARELNLCLAVFCKPHEMVLLINPCLVSCVEHTRAHTHTHTHTVLRVLFSLCSSQPTHTLSLLSGLRFVVF